MRDTLQEIFSKLGQSDPVFTGTLSEGGDIEFVVKKEYEPQSSSVDLNDPVTRLVVDNYSETFNRENKRFEKHDACKERALREMHISVKNALVNASPLKNPQQSKLYKWFEFDMIKNVPHRREGLIALFRYVIANTDNRSRYDSGSENVHAKNLIAILEKMKEKYEQR